MAEHEGKGLAGMKEALAAFTEETGLGQIASNMARLGRPFNGRAESGNVRWFGP